MSAPPTLLVARLPLAVAATLVAGACMVPSLDGEFSVDPTAPGGGSTSGDETSSSSSSGKNPSSSSSSGETSSSSSSSSGGSDSGTDGTAPPGTFCERSTTAATKFCSDFTLGGDGWVTEAVNGTVTFPGADAERHLLAVVNAGTNSPGASVSRELTGVKIPAGKTLHLQLRFSIEANGAGKGYTYANVALIKIGGLATGLERGVSVNACGSDPTSVCATDNDRTEFGDASRATAVKLTPGKTYAADVKITRKATTNYKTVISLDGAVLTTRDPDVQPTGENAALHVIAGATNAGDNNQTTGVHVDDVLVNLLDQ